MMNGQMHRSICFAGGRLHPCRIVYCAAWLFTLLTAGFVMSQTAEFSPEEIDYRDSMAETPGIRTGSGAMAPALMAGSHRQIGAARNSVRGGRGGGGVMFRYDQHREITPPTDATLRIGPWYSNLGMNLGAGYRYTRFSGTGVDFLENNDRGEVKDDGSEFPLRAGLSLGNYLILTRKLDIRLDISVNYVHYPLETQEDELNIDLTDEGIYATFSTSFQPSRYSRFFIYDDILYRTDYIDPRGLEDYYGGSAYEYFQNIVGIDWDWQPAPMDSFSASVSRQDTIPMDDEFDSQEVVRYAEMLSYSRRLARYAIAGVVGNAAQSLAQTDERPDSYIYGLNAFTDLQLTRNTQAEGSIGQNFAVTSGGNLEEDRETSSLAMGIRLMNDLPGDRSQEFGYSRSLSESFEGGVDIMDVLSYSYRWSRSVLPGSFSTTYVSSDPQDGGRSDYADWTSRLDLRYRLTRKIRLNFALSYAMRMNDDVGVDDEGNPELSNDYETLTATLGTSFRLTRKSSFSAYASHVDRTSDNADLAYTRDMVGFDVVWAHQF